MAALAGDPLEAEFAYTSHKIGAACGVEEPWPRLVENMSISAPHDQCRFCSDLSSLSCAAWPIPGQNFSNYSAWHRRSCLLPSLASASAQSKAGPAGAPSELPPSPPVAVLDAEYNLVKQALFTEPDDQSGWLYHRWLLGQTSSACGAAGPASTSSASVAPAGPGARSRAETVPVLRREAAMCRELLALEPGSKWALLTLARLLMALVAAGASSELQLGGAGEPAAGRGALLDDVRGIYRRLAGVDPLRRGYYADALTAAERAFG